MDEPPLVQQDVPVRGPTPRRPSRPNAPDIVRPRTRTPTLGGAAADDGRYADLLTEVGQWAFHVPDRTAGRAALAR
jgi:hypothetical protein